MEENKNMKMLKRLSVAATLATTFLFTIVVNADEGDAPQFNGDEAKNAVNPYLQGLTSFMLWMVPLAFVVSALVSGVKYFFMDEREKEQKPITKTITKLAIAAVVIWSVPLIARIIGIA
jgi:cytochrome bd-type quinol oxidase subunit 2